MVPNTNCADGDPRVQTGPGLGTFTYEYYFEIYITSPEATRARFSIVVFKAFPSDSTISCIQ